MTKIKQGTFEVDENISQKIDELTLQNKIKGVTPNKSKSITIGIIVTNAIKKLL